MFSFLPREGSGERQHAGRALPQPLLEIQRQLVHGMALNWLHSETSGPILSDETERCAVPPQRRTLQGQRFLFKRGEARFETICPENVE